ncbi:unnamed protein product [Leptidea sinapis]|uniref:C2H2-type domain-containing protein n=1 Tax=Leptidea sinapis TaxID=189913 RepID=A0A5E4PWG4_9NEOP|nr:unnamed protein product [Leptidea sinapis]
MSSSPRAHVGELATLVRSVEARFLGDASSEASAENAEDFELEDCKIRRNYCCTKCKFYTQNPRAYLYHTRDVHFEKFKIHECPHCVYASRHQQKLSRHIRLIHDTSADLKIEANVPDRVKFDNADEMLDEVDYIDENMPIDVLSYHDVKVEGVELNNDDNSNGEVNPKGKFYTCNKCNYVTHLKARYAKHLSNHSLPMIKCTVCDFRTPYKWSLDRHMKNHGGKGNFRCAVCNFTTDIRQSMTVHEVNHHTPSVGNRGSIRCRYKVGGTNLNDLDSADENSLILKEEESDSQSSQCASLDMGVEYNDKDMINCNSDSNEATTPEMQLQYSNQSDDSKKHSKKAPRPIPQLIPLSCSTPSQNKPMTGEPPAKKFKEDNSFDTDTIKQKYSSLDISITSYIPKESTNRKKNESFFDRLKERILTETGEEGSLKCKKCGFESKCLSEYSVHEKNCMSQCSRSNTLPSTLGSTRCQNCRHRCKSSADLVVHLKSCIKSDPEAQVVESQKCNGDKTTITLIDKDVGPHPMENVVFVWNNINREENKFDTPLDINITDDSTLPESKLFDSEIVDDGDGMNLSPSQAVGKKVFKCPHCLFWASTASRFHVHIVAHLNRKPFECSLCKYKSNWRWDITKHIKLKSARDPEHAEAKVLMTDETGRRNYIKYNKYLAVSILNDKGENEFHYIDPNAPMDANLDEDTLPDAGNDTMNYDIPLNLQTQQNYNKIDLDMNTKKVKKTIWKCKKDSSKEALIEHVREHTKGDDGSSELKSELNKKLENTVDPADLAYRCGHCNQLSNWKHVIQRHCRLKHDGIINVITTVKPKYEPGSTNDIVGDMCPKCPFKSNEKSSLVSHMQNHQPSRHSIFKCYFCPYFVKDEQELIQHLVLHGVNDPEEYISKAMGSKSPLPDQINSQFRFSISATFKRHKCTECPYETNSKSQFMYHEQFHRLPADTPYKCPECNYSVSKRHLLQQHLRVHGIFPNKEDGDFDPITNSNESEMTSEVDEIPFVWVSAKDEFHKMYKCRYCSYVNAKECKIPNHEQIHCIVFENSDITIFKCLECKFTCDSKSRLADHSKTHGEIYGRIYCPVEFDVPDEEQIAKLRKVLEKDKLCSSDESLKEDAVIGDTKEIKTMYFCQKCPARFFSENELRIHDKFHDLIFLHKCKSCEFSVPQENELNMHNCVHTDEYNTKTKMLKFMHKINSVHKEPRTQLVHCPVSSEGTWVVANPGKNFQIVENNHKRQGDQKHGPKQYYCKECPAKFFKSSALNYHAGLHGAEGDHKCKKCSYTVRNIGNLAKHELLHEKERKPSGCEYDSGDDLDFKNIPLSGTDLFQRKTEAQKRVLTDKDKLVKPNDHFPPVLQADPQFGYLMHGNPEFIYPTYLKNGRQKEKRYKCHKCPSAFEKREQYKIHLSLHGSKQRYKCEICDYSVKYYANYVQHMRKHQMNDEALAERKKGSNGLNETEHQENKQGIKSEAVTLAIKTMPKRVKSDFQQFSISDQQTLRLLQRRRSFTNNANETNATDPSPTKDRKLLLCMLCPYTNQRQDALQNHYKRHDESDSFISGNNKCSFCDLVVVQSHFLREHLKTHFNYMKNISPECYAANEGVSFSFTKVDEEDCKPTELKLKTKNTGLLCNEDKLYVKIETGEFHVQS